MAWDTTEFIRTGRCYWDAGPFEEGAGYELPEEFYLRDVMDLDLTSDDDVAEFVSTYGFVLYGSEDHRMEVSAVWEYAEALEGLPEKAAGQLIGCMQGRYVGDRRYEFSEGVEQRFGSWEARPRSSGLMYELAIESRAGLACLRDLTRLLQHWRKNRFRTLPNEWDLALFDVDPPGNADEAFAFLVGAINGALRDVSARLIPEPDYRVGATLFTAAVAEMFNHLAQGADYKTCSNETCGRAFVHQVDGTSRYGQYRSEGVLYCSNRCARAQAQREYRRRKKQT